MVRVVLIAPLNNGCVEGSAKLLGLRGQTVRNHLKLQDPCYRNFSKRNFGKFIQRSEATMTASRFFHVNCELVEAMNRLGVLSKPHLTLAIDWHDEMCYGDT